MSNNQKFYRVLQRMLSKVKKLNWTGPLWLCALLCGAVALLGLLPVAPRSAEAAGTGEESVQDTPETFESFESFAEFVDAVRRGQPTDDTTSADYPGFPTAWTAYRVATAPEGCSTEAGIRSTLGEPDTVREMAGWKMLAYPDAGWLFVVSPLGNAAAAAYASSDDTDATADRRLAVSEEADSDANSYVFERIASYMGDWTGLRFERPAASNRDNGKETAREAGATSRDANTSARLNLFTPREYDVRDRTLRLIRSAM